MAYGRGGRNKKKVQHNPCRKGKRQQRKHSARDVRQRNRAQLQQAATSPQEDLAVSTSESENRTAVVDNENKPTKLSMPQESKRTYAAVAFVYRFNEPDKSQWSTVAKVINEEISYSVPSCTKLFERIAKGQDPIQACKFQVGENHGRPRKLEKDNKGLVAATLALNGGASPRIAASICNSINPEEQSICRNTLLNTIDAYNANQTNVSQAPFSPY